MQNSKTNQRLALTLSLDLAKMSLRYGVKLVCAKFKGFDRLKKSVFVDEAKQVFEKQRDHLIPRREGIAT
jgi:hypothetical protein